MSYETILTNLNNGVMTITMNRPERLNAWTGQMGSEMRDVLVKGNADHEVEAFIVTGAGRGFCAGADIKDVFKAQSDSGEKRERSDGASDWVKIVRESKPVIAAVNGAAIGVGLTQILPMDYIVASQDAKLSCRFIKMGLVPELASSHFLVTRCGFGAANELMLTGKTIMAEEAFSLRLVDKVVPADELMDAATAMAKAMGENPQSALRMVKSLITSNMVESDTDVVQRREMASLVQCYETPEHKEAISAFLEKRDPDFQKARGS